MIEVISLLPLVVAIIGGCIFRYANCSKPFPPSAWAVIMVGLIVAFFAPLAIGVWIPDFTGKSRSLGQTIDSKGQRFEVFQFWNRIDFYTTELEVVEIDGTVRRVIIDGDSSKGWSASITVDEAKHTAAVVIDGMGYPPVVLREQEEAGER